MLVATRRLPSVAYGVRNRSENCAAVRKFVSEIFGAESLTALHRHAYGQGTAIFVPDEEETLRQVLMSLKPQLALDHPDIDIRGAKAAR